MIMRLVADSAGRNHVEARGLVSQCPLTSDKSNLLEPSVKQWAEHCVSRGWAPVPVPFRSKKPALDAGQTLRVTKESVGDYFNGSQRNIGILLGEPYGCLVSVDKDSPEVVEPAPWSFRPRQVVPAAQVKPRSTGGPDGLAAECSSNRGKDRLDFRWRTCPYRRG